MDTVIAPHRCPATLYIQLPPGSQAARYARRTVTGLLAPEQTSCPRAVAEDLVLIVSELVTNAVLHAKGPYGLTVSLEEGRAGVAVSDGSADLSQHHAGASRQRAEPGGRGLKIVRELGADLFVSRSGIGKHVIAILTW